MKSNTVMLCYRNRNGRELRERLVCNIIFPPCCEAWRQRTKTKHLLALVHHLIFLQVLRNVCALFLHTRRLPLHTSSIFLDMTLHIFPSFQEHLRCFRHACLVSSIFTIFLMTVFVRLHAYWRGCRYVQFRKLYHVS